MKYKIFAIFQFFILSAKFICAQQDPTFVQYKQLARLLNPSFFGQEGEMHISGFHALWYPKLIDSKSKKNIGPRTTGASVGLPIKIKNNAKIVSLGTQFTYMQDLIGYERNEYFQLALNTTYKLNINNFISLGIEPIISSKIIETQYLIYDSLVLTTPIIKDKKYTSINCNMGIQYTNSQFHRFQIGIAVRHIAKEQFNMQLPNGTHLITVPKQINMHTKIEFIDAFFPGLDITPSMFYQTVYPTKMTTGVLQFQTQFTFWHSFDVSPTLHMYGTKVEKPGVIVGLYPIHWFSPHKKYGSLRLGISYSEVNSIYKKRQALEFAAQFTKNLFEP